MTVVVTRDVPGRFRGFLASCMLEIGQGVYTAPIMNSGVRDRVWRVLTEWFQSASPNASIVMTWVDTNEPDRQGIRTLGIPPKTIVDFEGIHLCKGPAYDRNRLASSLTTENSSSQPSSG